MKQVTIVWLDNQAAKIITATPIEILSIDEISSLESQISSDIGAGEFRKLKKQARSDYFSSLATHVKDSREIVLFGTDNTKEEFLDYLNENVKLLFSKVIGVESAQDMVEEKIIARGRKYL